MRQEIAFLVGKNEKKYQKYDSHKCRSRIYAVYRMWKEGWQLAFSNIGFPHFWRLLRRFIGCVSYFGNASLR
jgi:hypothetical protein